MAATARVDANSAFGRDLIEALDQEPPEMGLQPTAAFWLLSPEEEIWRQIIALVQQKLPDAASELERIGLAPPDFPLVQLLRSAISTGADAIGGIRFTDNVIKGEWIEDAYIYRVA